MKTFSDGTHIAYVANGLTLPLSCVWMLHNDGSHRKKSAFPPYVVFMMKQRPQFGWTTSRVDDTRSYGSVLILCSRGGQTAAREPHAAL